MTERHEPVSMTKGADQSTPETERWVGAFRVLRVASCLTCQQQRTAERRAAALWLERIRREAGAL